MVATDLPGVKVVREAAAPAESIKILMKRGYESFSFGKDKASKPARS